MKKNNAVSMLRHALDPQQAALIVIDSEGFYAMRCADFQPRSTVLTMSGQELAAIIEKATGRKIGEALELEEADRILQEEARAYYFANSPNRARGAI